MRRVLLAVVAASGLTGCNVVPPLDCLMGVERPGCHRDANGVYGYLYTSPLLPAPNAGAVPVGFAPVPVPPPAYAPPLAPAFPTRYVCSQNGTELDCRARGY